MAERRAKILNAAANLFATHGYSGTTMSDVIAVVGGSKATLYRHFPSKEDLLLATLEMAATVETDKLQALLDRDAPIQERIDEFCRNYLQYLIRPEVIHMRRLTRTELGRPDTSRRIYQQMVVPGWKRVADAIEAAMASGALRRGDAWRATMHLKSMLEGYVPELLAAEVIDRPGEDQVLALADDVAAVFLRAYRPD